MKLRRFIWGLLVGALTFGVGYIGCRVVNHYADTIVEWLYPTPRRIVAPQYTGQLASLGHQPKPAPFLEEARHNKSGMKGEVKHREELTRRVE